MSSQNSQVAVRKLASSSAYIAGEVAAGRAYCAGFEVGTRSCFGLLDGFGTLSFLADRPDGGVTFGQVPGLPFRRGDPSSGAETIMAGVERALETGRDAIVHDALRGLGLDDKTRGETPVAAPWSDRLMALLERIDWSCIVLIDRARIDGRFYRACLPDVPDSGRTLLLRTWVVGASGAVDLDGLDPDLPLAENVMRIVEATREAPLPGRDRAWLRNALDALEGLSVPSAAVPGVLAWLSGNPARSTVPASREQWQAFLDIHALRRMFENRTRLVLPRLSEMKGGDYLGVRDRVSYGHVRSDGSANVEAICEILWAPIIQFVDHVVRPMAVRLDAGMLIGPYNANAEAFAYGLMAADKGLGGLKELSDDFHSRFPHVARALGTAVEGLGLCWEAAFPGLLDMGEGWAARCLTTPEELAAEGDENTGLDHCVGGYFQKCIRDGLVVVSVRRDGERVETMSFAYDGVWRLSEHFGHANAKPGEGYQSRFTAVAREIIRHSPKGMLARRYASGSDVIGYDPNRTGAVEAVCEAFLPLLPRNVRGDGFDGVYGRLRAALAAMDPQGLPLRPLRGWR